MRNNLELGAPKVAASGSWCCLLVQVKKKNPSLSCSDWPQAFHLFDCLCASCWEQNRAQALALWSADSLLFDSFWFFFVNNPESVDFNFPCICWEENNPAGCIAAGYNRCWVYYKDKERELIKGRQRKREREGADPGHHNRKLFPLYTEWLMKLKSCLGWASCYETLRFCILTKNLFSGISPRASPGARPVVAYQMVEFQKVA